MRGKGWRGGDEWGGGRRIKPYHRQHIKKRVHELDGRAVKIESGVDLSTEGKVTERSRSPVLVICLICSYVFALLINVKHCSLPAFRKEKEKKNSQRKLIRKRRRFLIGQNVLNGQNKTTRTFLSEEDDETSCRDEVRSEKGWRAHIFGINIFTQTTDKW